MCHLFMTFLFSTNAVVVCFVLRYSSNHRNDKEDPIRWNLSIYRWLMRTHISQNIHYFPLYQYHCIILNTSDNRHYLVQTPSSKWQDQVIPSMNTMMGRSCLPIPNHSEVLLSYIGQWKKMPFPCMGDRNHLQLNCLFLYSKIHSCLLRCRIDMS